MRVLFALFCPVGQYFIRSYLSLPWESDPAGEKHGGRGVIPGAIFMVAHQRETPAGKLHPDLMTAAGM